MTFLHITRMIGIIITRCQCDSIESHGNVYALHIFDIDKINNGKWLSIALVKLTENKSRYT